MKRTAFLAAVALAAAVSLAGGSPKPDLSPQGERVLKYLRTDWSKSMHSTSIPLAMKNLGMAPDDDLRLAIGQHLRDHVEIANNLKWWGANNYILSNEEKRIAKLLLNTFESDDRLPSLEEASRTLEIPQDRLKGRLAFLSRAGLLAESGQDGVGGFKLAEKYGRWGGPLRYNFHTIAAGDDKPYDVW